MVNPIRKLTGDEQGSTAIEYGLLVAVIASGLIVTLQVIGLEFSSILNTVAEGIEKGSEVFSK